MHFLRSHGVLGLLLLPLGVFACDDTASTASTASTGSASTTSDVSSSGSGSTTSSGAGGMGGAPAYVPPPVKAACDAPTKGLAQTITGPGMERFGSPQLAWDGTSAALAYAETDGMDTWSIQLQPVALDGSVSTPVVTVANQQKSGFVPPTIALASGGGATIVCNDNQSATPQLRCFAVAGGAPSLGLTVQGSQPTLAFGAGGFGLVYADGGTLFAQKLNADATPNGPPAEVAKSSSMSPPAPTLTATGDGYAALSAAWGLMWRFDGTFTEIEGMAVAGWKNAPTRIAGNGSVVGAVYGESSGVKFRSVDAGGTLGATVKIDAPTASSIYQYTAITRADAGTFAAVWSEFEGNVGYRAIDAAGMPIGAVADVLPTNWDDNAVAIVAVSDGFLVAATQNPSNDAIGIVKLGCP